MKRSIPLLLSIFFFLLPPAHAEDAPLWELGIGVAGWHLPDYRGSNESRFYVLPFPYPIYRGDIIKAEGSSLSGLLFKTDRLKLDVSLAGSLPVHSDKNHAREGMPDIDLTGEIGPSLEWKFFKKTPDALWLRIPLRGVFSVPDMNYRGLKLAPYLEYERVLSILPGWRMSLSGGPIFGTERYHDYLYEVNAAFARPDRPEFHPSAGYSGSAVIFGMNRRYGDFLVGAGIRYDYLAGAAFEESPLVKTNSYFSAGIMLTWFFAKSKTMVKRPADGTIETPVIRPEKVD